MTRARAYDRDSALDAALILFWRKGYHATSLKDLEAALAMKLGSIYAAFKSKEELYLATPERYFQRNRAQLARLRGEAVHGSRARRFSARFRAVRGRCGGRAGLHAGQDAARRD